MPDAQQLWMFMVAGVLLNLTPGPDVLFIVSQSLRGGVRSGLVAAWGITAGCFVHVAAAALGVGVLLANSAAAFNAVKWLGAAYLMWIGVRLLWSTTKSGVGAGDARSALPAQIDRENGPEAPGLPSVFFKAFATNAFNPKVALFFLAFVPQFVPVNSPDPAWTFVLLGCLFNFNGLLIGMAWALAASWLSLRARLLQSGLQHLDRLAGFMFVGFGLKLALTQAPTH
ncbi:LysE family translocator [Limnohabitans sp. Rim47]|uniref:LysE family translocator n=1 Tax=Limnohabitans sp. Rim47 TaxID=1100721 RepID=UPI00037A998A|nr:LysE family translocator [Limnohabitans sp. Rim47]